MSQRGPVSIMLSVWKALFLREAGVRLFGSRGAWAWLFIEPLVHLAFISYLFSVIRQRHVDGIDVVLFLLLGLIGFFVFRRTADQMGGAIGSSRAMFTYRQVVPFDPIMVRGFVEVAILAVTFFLTLIGLRLLEFDIVPERPLGMVAGYASLWLLGTGLGLTTAILGEIVQESRKVIKLMMMPLYFLSAVIFPISIVPPEYRHVMLYNPIVHGIETIRISFSNTYHSDPGIDLSYTVIWAIGFWAIGLLLYRGFSHRVVAA